MPLGLKGAGRTFQRLIYSVLRDLLLVFVHLDDIFVASPWAEHLLHQQVFQCLEELDLIVNPAKSQFRLPVIDFLGYHLSSQGAIPLASKVDAVGDFLRLVVVKALQEFLSVENFYICFLPHAAQLLQPLDRAFKIWKANDLVDWIPEQSRHLKELNLPLQLWHFWCILHYGHPLLLQPMRPMWL